MCSTACFRWRSHSPWKKTECRRSRPTSCLERSMRERIREVLAPCRLEAPRWQHSHPSGLQLWRRRREGRGWIAGGTKFIEVRFGGRSNISDRTLPPNVQRLVGITSDTRVRSSGRDLSSSSDSSARPCSMCDRVGLILCVPRHVSLSSFCLPTSLRLVS